MDGAMRRVEVVAGVLEDRGEVLCARRGPSPHAHLDGKWEFPGGKVEPGESHAAALVREWHEELGVGIEVGSFLCTITHRYPDWEVVLHVYHCHWSAPGERSRLLCHDHVAVCWLPVQRLREVDGEWAAADVPVVDWLLTRRNT